MKSLLILVILMVTALTDDKPRQHVGCLGTGHDLGEATDIDALNGKPVGLYGKDKDVTKMVEETQRIFNHPQNGGPPAAENYGPAGLYRSGKRIFDRALRENHKDHIHVRFY